MVRRAYCIECRKLHRRDPATWTNRSCCRCGGEVRFSGGPIPRETVTISVKGLPDVRALLGPDPVAAGEDLLLRDARARAAGSDHGPQAMGPTAAKVVE